MGQKISLNISRQKKNSWDKKKSSNLLGQKNHPASWDIKNHQTSWDKTNHPTSQKKSLVLSTHNYIIHIIKKLGSRTVPSNTGSVYLSIQKNGTNTNHFVLMCIICLVKINFLSRFNLVPLAYKLL